LLGEGRTPLLPPKKKRELSFTFPLVLQNADRREEKCPTFSNLEKKEKKNLFLLMESSLIYSKLKGGGGQLYPSFLGQRKREKKRAKAPSNGKKGRGNSSPLIP